MIKNTLILENPTLVRSGIFSLQDAQKELGWPKAVLNPMLSRLVRSGKLVRVKRGLFCIRPAGTETAQGLPSYNWFAVVKKIMEGRRHYFSHYSAMHLHGLTGESIQTIFVSLEKQTPLSRGVKIPIHCVTAGKHKFWGLEEKWVTNEEKVWVTDLERTFLDAFDRLDLSGGIMEVARGFSLALKKINLKKLIQTAKKFNSAAAAKRLGLLMDLLQAGSPDEREEFRSFVLKQGSYAILDPTLPKKGNYMHRWRLLVNFDVENMKRNLMT